MGSPEPIHQSDPKMKPDAEFTPGSWAQLVVGNVGRLLDGRRTPIRIVALDDTAGRFTIEIMAFEDAGAYWEIEYEKIGNIQLLPESESNSDARVSEIESISAKFDKPLEIPCDPAARDETERRLAGEMASCRAWLWEHSQFLAGGGAFPDPETREGDPRLSDDLKRFMETRNLRNMEEAFSRQFVSAPMAKIIRGHRIVIAQIGLAPYVGKIARDPAIFVGDWSRKRRADHVLMRLAFLRGFAAESGIESFSLYRGVSTEGEIEPTRNETFVSASFSRAVAESLADSYGEKASSQLLHQNVPVNRVFMTYLETSAMNRQFKEAEAVLFFEDGNPVF